MEYLHVVVATFYSIAEWRRRADPHDRSSDTARNKFKSPNRRFMCVQQTSFHLFSGWFVEPRLRAVSMNIECFNGCCWSSVVRLLSFSCVHTMKISMFIIPVSWSAVVVFINDYCLQQCAVETLRMWIHWEVECAHTNVKILVMKTVAVWELLFWRERF